MDDSRLKKNPKAYIDFLQSQNRAKKQNELEDKEKIANKQKEEAFNIYLQGANQERVDDQRKRERKDKLREKSKGPNTRKKWSADIPRPKTTPKPPSFHPDAYSPLSLQPRSESLRNIHINNSIPIIKSDKELIIEHLHNFDEENLENVLNFLNNLLSPLYTELKIQINSNWGCAHSIGITEIELLNSKNQPIKLSSSEVTLENSESSSVSRLINGEKYTNNHKNMWIAPLPMPPLHLNIIFTINHYITGIRIWNYNKSILDSTKGIKDITIYKNNKIIYQGEINKAYGNPTIDYYTEIFFTNNDNNMA